MKNSETAAKDRTTDADRMVAFARDFFEALGVAVADEILAEEGIEPPPTYPTN